MLGYYETFFDLYLTIKNIIFSYFFHYLPFSIFFDGNNPHYPINLNLFRIFISDGHVKINVKKKNSHKKLYNYSSYLIKLKYLEEIWSIVENLLSFYQEIYFLQNHTLSFKNVHFYLFIRNMRYGFVFDFYFNSLLVPGKIFSLMFI